MSDVARLLEAANFAAEKHRSQCRKDVSATPYVNHPIAVATLLATSGNVDDIALLVAALLHDTVEDTRTTADEIAAQFGADVRDLVAEVTDDKSLPKTRRKQLQVETAPQKSIRAKQLKIADKICNVRDIDTASPADWNANRKHDYLDWAVQVVAGCRGVNPQLESIFDAELASARKRLEI